MNRFLFLAIATALLACAPTFAVTIDFKQCANGPNAQAQCQWINGILQASNSRYSEGQAVPQRLIIANIYTTPTGWHTARISHSATKGGIHAYDFLVGWNQGTLPPISLNPCGASLQAITQQACLTLRQSQNAVQVTLPDDPFMDVDGATQQRINAFEAQYGDRMIIIYADQPITNAYVALNHTATGATDSDVFYDISWQGPARTVMIEWGGHLARSGTGPDAWGVGKGASFVSGGSYHMEMKTLDFEAVGQRDNQIAGNAIVGGGDTPAFCGDNRTNAPGEECDDGNTNFGDGCTPACQREPTCTEHGCQTTCGDGLWDNTTEGCDDGNILNGDGCSATCTVESGYTCVLNPGGSQGTLVLPIVYRDFQIAHPDFEYTLGTDRGIVGPNLGVTGKPVYANPAGTTPTTTGRAAFDQWYQDIPGVNIPLVRQISLTRRPSGVFQYANSSFFPIDNLGWGNEGNAHNFHFTSEVRYWFQYAGNETFDFTGDDDVFVFINGRLAVDLGGVHAAQSASVTLDAAAAQQFGLQIGTIYEIAVFQAERHTVASNYRLTLGDFQNLQVICSPVPPYTPISCASVTPRHIVNAGTSLTIPFSDVFDLGQNGLQNYTAAVSAPPGTTVAPNIGTGQIDIVVSALTGAATPRVTLTHTPTGTPLTCPIELLSLPASCDTPACRACGNNAACYTANNCVSGSLSVYNPWITTSASRLITVTPGPRWFVTAFSAIDPLFTIAPTNGPIYQVFQIVSTAPAGASTIAVMELGAQGYSGTTQACISLNRLNTPVGVPGSLIDSELIVTSSRAVLHTFEDSGYVGDIGPYLFTAKVWTR